MRCYIFAKKWLNGIRCKRDFFLFDTQIFITEKIKIALQINGFSYNAGGLINWISYKEELLGSRCIFKYRGNNAGKSTHHSANMSNKTLEDFQYEKSCFALCRSEVKQWYLAKQLTSTKFVYCLQAYLT